LVDIRCSHSLICFHAPLGRRTEVSLLGLTVAVLSAALLTLPVTSRAQGFAEVKSEREAIGLQSDSALAAALADLSGQPITLSEARESAMKNSTGVAVAEAMVRAAKGIVRRERGGFDPTVFSELTRSGTKTPASSPFAGASALDEITTDLRSGVNWRLRFGTELELSINSNRLETNSNFAALDPEYSAYGRLDIRQPLLAGSWFAAKAPVTAAERVEEAAVARYRDAVLGVIQSVDETYWDLYAAERDLAVLRSSVDQAEAFLSEVRIRAEAGLIGPGDVASATVFLSQQQQAELDGREQLDRVSNRLITLIGRRPSNNERRLRTIDSPGRPVARVGDADSLASVAIDRNYVVMAAELELEASKALTRGATWNLLPELDLIASIGGNGLSGTAREVIFGSDTLRTTFDGPRSKSLDQVFGRDYPTWTIGVRFSLPIGMRATRGERDRLKAQEAAAFQNLAGAKRSVEEQVRNAVLEYGNAEHRLTAAGKGVRAAQELVRIGDIDFRVGRVSAFELVRLNADLASAQLRYSNALVRAAKASSALRRLTGEDVDVATLYW
jgi:outer membrane protein TolC